MFITLNRKSLYRFSFVICILLTISSLYILFIKEAFDYVTPAYLPSPPPAIIQHVKRHDNAISLTINYTGDSEALPYVLDVLNETSTPYTIFLPLELLMSSTSRFDTNNDHHATKKLYEWGGLINYKTDTLKTPIPEKIRFLRQLHANTDHLKRSSELKLTSVGATLTFAEPHHTFNNQIKQTLLNNVTPGDIIAIELNQNIVNGTLLTKAINNCLTEEGFNIIPLSQLLFEEEKLKIERIE